MIRESLKIHGKQFEIKQKVLFPRKSKEIRYQVETFFFLPSSLQVNPDYTHRQTFNVASKIIFASALLRLNCLPHQMKTGS
ncbi:hypothetical protein AB6F55_02955 [Providencia hangzhouensis]